jgi:hypothetical protein
MQVVGGQWMHEIATSQGVNEAINVAESGRQARAAASVAENEHRSSDLDWKNRTVLANAIRRVQSERAMARVGAGIAEVRKASWNSFVDVPHPR